MDLGLKGKNALITGGSRGIGLAITHALSEEGCNVAICARHSEHLVKTAVSLKRKSVDVLPLLGDALSSSDIERVVGTVIRRWGVIGILVNNVGGGGRWGSTFEDTEEQVWTDVYNKNAMAAMRFTKLVIPFMRKQKWGRVVTISSIYGKEGGGRPWFNMAKSAEISLMKSLSMDKRLVRDGITFNTVCPGHISVEGKTDEDNVEDFPLGRMGSPEEVANVVAFLCSEKTSLVNGACVVVDGGESRSF